MYSHRMKIYHTAVDINYEMKCLNLHFAHLDPIEFSSSYIDYTGTVCMIN